MVILAAALCLAWFSAEISDPDFWWHLKTGQYILEKRALPVPDPFNFTTARAATTYAGEELTRHFNLTHEWLAQLALYAVYRVGGFPGVVLLRATLLAALCGLVGLVVHRRCGSLYWAAAAALATATIAIPFAVDRPFLITFLMLAATIAILEFQWTVWILPATFLIWANCHGGYFLGWVVLGAYSAEALWLYLRAQPLPHSRRLWIVSALSFLASGINPNGFRIPQILMYYRSSYLNSRLLEWARPVWWRPGEFTILLFAAGALLLLARRKVRPSDWLLFFAFSVAALSAQRNTILIGILAPIMIASYFPWRGRWGTGVPVLLCLILAGAGISATNGHYFQLRAAEWRYPSGAADFLLAHHIPGPIFNTYEYGGYLIWRLWPEYRVFIDGRALSESVFTDYGRILYNHDESGGKSAQELLDQYGIQTIVMNTMEYNGGLIYLLAPALADPAEKTWKLIYSDPAAIVLMRRPPPGIPALDSLGVLEHMEAECSLHLEHQPQLGRCAKALAQVFVRVGDLRRTRYWLGVYLDHPHGPDPQAEEQYQQLIRGGH